RKMVESRSATPRPDHMEVEPSRRPDEAGRSRSLHGERLLLLYSRYLTPGSSRSLSRSPVTVAGPRRLLTGFPLGSRHPEPDCGGTMLAERTLALPVPGGKVEVFGAGFLPSFGGRPVLIP